VCHSVARSSVTLMGMKDPPDPEQQKILPVVRYAVERRIAAGTPDYWDWATLLELAVLARDQAGAAEALGRALTAVRESWEPETTTRNLRLIREVRVQRHEAVEWIGEIESELAAEAVKHQSRT
jgi:hypothetical protein